MLCSWKWRVAAYLCALVWFPVFFHPLHSCRASKPGASLRALYISLVNLHSGLYRPHASMPHFIQTFTPKHLHSGPVWWNMKCNIWLGHMGRFSAASYLNTCCVYLNASNLHQTKSWLIKRPWCRILNMIICFKRKGGVSHLLCLICLFGRLLTPRLIGWDSTGSGQMCVVPICQENDLYA